MKRLMDIIEGLNIVNQISLKKAKSWQGREGYGLLSDFYLNGKQMGLFYDDANGGMPDIKFLSPLHEKEFKTFLVENNVAKLLQENGWDFLTIDQISIDIQTECLINEAFDLIQIKKAKKKEKNNSSSFTELFYLFYSS